MTSDDATAHLEASPIPRGLLERMICPHCGSPVTQNGAVLRCDRSHELRFRDGYIDASIVPANEATARTLESFGYEWSTFDKIQPEDEPFWRRYFADVPDAAFAGKVGLDAGCGKGRFSYFTAPQMKHVVALDGSDAVRAAVNNLASCGNVTVVRADFAAIPFATETFDFVWCLGVLHHLSDPEAGFHEVVSRLAPGGGLLIYVYSAAAEPGVRSVALRAATALRKVTVRMPHAVLRFLCAPLAALLYAAIVVPGAIGERLGRRRLASLPLQTYRGRPLRSLWLDTFDRLSAPVENRYVWSDIAPWFERASLTVESVREDAGLIVFARKPGRP